MEILVNDKLIAMGEVVVINEKFGIRLTDIVSQYGINKLSDESLQKVVKSEEKDEEKESIVEKEQ